MDILRETKAGVEENNIVNVTFFYRWRVPSSGVIGHDCPPESCHWWRYEALPNGDIVLVEEGGAVLPGESEVETPVVTSTISSTPTILSSPAPDLIDNKEHVEAINAIRTLSGLPELPLEFIETTLMLDSPAMDLQVALYPLPEGARVL